MTEDWGLIPEREPERWLPLLRKAAGAQITQCQNGEVVTINNDVDSLRGSTIGMSSPQTIEQVTIGGKAWCQHPR